MESVKKSNTVLRLLYYIVLCYIHNILFFHTVYVCIFVDVVSEE